MRSMQTRNRFLDDIAKLATSAAGLANGVREEIELIVRNQIARIREEMDTIPREEFEVVREMAETARLTNDALSARIDALEARLAEFESAGGSSSGDGAPARRARSKRVAATAQDAADESA